jgi:hypothetical protein
MITRVVNSSLKYTSYVDKMWIKKFKQLLTSLVIILLDVCVICEIVTLPEDEPVNGSKHIGV